VPVVIDDTSERYASVPDRFRDVQWSRLPAGQTPPAFVERIARLLSQTPSAESWSGSEPSVRQPVPQAAVSRQLTHLLLLVGVVVCIIGLGYLGIHKLMLSNRGTSEGKAASLVQPDATPSTTTPEKSIAVLPFVDMSEKHDQEYFSDGLSEEMIDLLTKVPDLRVPARTSSFFFKGKPEDIATIAQKLHVTNVLEGSVRKAGNTIRVTAQLIRADNGYHLWSETYERDLKDVFRVQDEIAGAVVSALKIKLAPGQVLSSAPTSNTEAHNQYLLGRQFSNRGHPDDYRRAAAAFRKAVELDPHYVVAYAWLAATEFQVAADTGDAPGKQRALALAEKTVGLAPEQAAGYAVRGYLRLKARWDWTGAEADLKRGLALDSRDAALQANYSLLLRAFGRFPEAIAAARKATELDPLSTDAWTTLGGYLLENRQFEAAHEALRRALEIEPESGQTLNIFGELQLLEGNATEALATYRQIGDYEVFRLSGVSMAEDTLGHATASQGALDELIAKDAQVFAYGIAEVYAWRGEKEKAFEWLEQAYRSGADDLVFVKDDALLASLRSDSRYKAFLRKMKLPE
jgi:TolB-like protein/tetratricopeptide (TPR) repeat protein